MHQGPKRNSQSRRKPEPIDPATIDGADPFQRLGPDGKPVRMGFFGWRDIASKSEPATFERVREAINATRWANGTLRPFELFKLTRDVLAQRVWR